MFDYSTGKIYQVVAPDGSIYVGSTICELHKRYLGHKAQYNRWKSGTEHYRTIFKLFDDHGISNCKIELIESYPCNSKKELEIREGHFIQTLKCVNKVVAGRDEAIWREENNERLKEYWKSYYSDNKERYIQRNVKYYADNSESERERHKKYMELNRDLVNERRRARYHEKKKKLSTIN